ncbi:MAG TPA: DMT family transporter [Gaiellaceae bacterium]|jgi:drug/metabolite transporter, DME family|nr:DMT family transporter [Gaiellaceae bacterium]
MRRPTTVELMLLTTVLLWALNLSVTKFILDEGLAPLSYAAVRYGLAAGIFVALALAVEGTLRVARTHLWRVGLAAVTLWVNQMCFVFALDLTAASTVGILLGAIPVFTGLWGLALGTERATGRFWLAAAVSFVGVALVALGAAGQVSASLTGIVLGIATAATWAAYSVVFAPLTRTYSVTRISAIVLPCTWLLLALAGVPQMREQDWSLGWEIWVLLLFATIGPLVLTNVLWFRSIRRIGANRATLVANLEPFVAAVLAVVLLSEPLGLLQVLGGVAIAGGIVLARGRPSRARAT